MCKYFKAACLQLSENISMKKKTWEKCPKIWGQVKIFKIQVIIYM
jgi:hypothetical protein